MTPSRQAYTSQKLSPFYLLTCLSAGSDADASCTLQFKKPGASARKPLAEANQNLSVEKPAAMLVKDAEVTAGIPQGPAPGHLPTRLFQWPARLLLFG